MHLLFKCAVARPQTAGFGNWEYDSEFLGYVGTGSSYESVANKWLN